MILILKLNEVVMKKLLLIPVLALSVSACQQSDYTRSDGAIKKETIGTIGGAVIGGVLGSKIGKGSGNGIAIGVGTLLGAALGQSIGSSLDNADLQMHNHAAQEALEVSQVGTTSEWYNPDSGHSGTITPTRTFEVARGEPCREYSQTITVGGKTERAYGTACRQADGSWQIQN